MSTNLVQNITVVVFLFYCGDIEIFLLQVADAGFIKCVSWQVLKRKKITDCFDCVWLY